MDTGGNKRFFYRYLTGNQSCLQVGLWRICIKTKKPKHFIKNLIDVSGGGLAFGLDLAEDLLLPGTPLEKIEIVSPDGCLLRTAGEVKYIAYNPLSPSGYVYKVGVGFELEMNDEERRRRSSLRRQREQITDPAVIRDNLNNIIEKRVSVLLEDIEHPLAPPVVGYFTRLADSIKFQTLTFEPLNPFLSARLFENFNRVQAVYQYNNNTKGYKFDSVVISGGRSKILIKLPRSINCLWQRSTLRYTPTPNDFIRLQFAHPMLKNTTREYRVLNLTPQGLSIAIDYPGDLFIRNMIIPRINLIIPGERLVTASAQIKYVCTFINEEGGCSFKCGLGFLNLSAKESDFLVSYLLNKYYPHLRDAQRDDIESIWRLFAESGFIYEEKRKFLSPVLTEVNHTFIKLLKPETRIYKKIVLKEGDKCYATVSGIWAYEHAWIVQHLAAIKHPRKFVSQDVVLAISDFCTKRPDIAYQILYWRPDNSWSDKIFGKFARQVSDKSELSHLVSYHYLFKSPLDDCPETDLPGGVAIEPLSEGDRPLIESYFIARREFIILQAHSLLREEIDLPCLCKLYARNGLKRERYIYLAKSGPVFLGFVLIEDSSLGTNLSGLINCFKVYTTPECGGMEAKIKRGLIQKAVEYYRKQNRNFAICLEAGEDMSVYETLGFIKKKEYMCWTLSRKLVLPFCDFIKEFFVRFEKRMAGQSSS